MNKNKNKKIYFSIKILTLIESDKYLKPARQKKKLEIKQKTDFILKLKN